LQDREEHEKTLKAKVKETHSELRELYDRLNQKEKELSGKVTELYQAKVLVMESEKIIEGLQGKCGATEKERNELRHML
jgi:chromosome segregation ATPase